MTCTEFENLGSIGEVFKRHKLYGANIPIYVEKQEMTLRKDRVAASFISDNVLSAEGNFTNTLISVIDNVDNNLKVFKSNICLPYEALLSFIYELRLDGYTTKCIANVSNGDKCNIVFIDGMHTDTNFIKISVSDNLRSLVQTLISESQARLKEKHIGRIVCLKEKAELSDIIYAAFNESYTIIAEYTITDEEHNSYKILDSLDVTCVIKKNHLLFISTKQSIKLNDFIKNLITLSDGAIKGADIKVTSELIMF